jgi:threonine dehydrogenase-like Zn-dependent dehydrogenase
MRAVCWRAPRDIRVETVPDPTLLNPRDAIIRVTATAICGSDLHLYNGIIPTMQTGDVLGHEFMGEVVEVGAGWDRCGAATASSSRSRSRAGHVGLVARA